MNKQHLPWLNTLSSFEKHAVVLCSSNCTSMLHIAGKSILAVQLVIVCDYRKTACLASRALIAESPSSTQTHCKKSPVGSSFIGFSQFRNTFSIPFMSPYDFQESEKYITRHSLLAM